MIQLATAWAESLRITGFTSADAVVTPDTWWKDVVGAEATVETLRKGRLIRQDQGDAIGGSLILTVQPGRVDWNLGAKMPENEPPQDFPSLGKSVESVPRFLELLSRWMPSSPPLDRIAFGLNAWTPVPNHEEAYGVLDALLPAVEFDPESSDFQYRINRPRASRLDVENLRINRLSTWTAIRMELVALTGGARPFRTPPSYANSPRRFRPGGGGR